jgi:ribonuclease Y
MFGNIVIVIPVFLAVLAVGLGVGYYFGIVKEKRKLDFAHKSAEQIVSAARREADQFQRDAALKTREENLRKRQEFEHEIHEKEIALSNYERDVNKREVEVKKRQSSLADLEGELASKSEAMEERNRRLQERQDQLNEIILSQNQRLEQLAGISKAEALAELKANLLNQAKQEIAQELFEYKQESKSAANKEAKEIIATAIENVAADYVQEATLNSVSLNSDKIKGMIIGKEGRNIKAFEAESGVKVIVDETPESVVLSSFDPIKREIARVAMTRLVKEKNINPKIIANEMKRATREVERKMREAAEAALHKLALKDVHAELKEHLGRLLYRTSYGQNILHHSTEVALLAGGMAAELGLDVDLAKRAGLFHDIGKSISHDANASHVELGVQITERCNEHPVVINSVLAHHEEAEPIAAESVLVTAADKISGARPGARRESLEAYTQRIEKLEEMANSFEGVAKTYAISAGREIRVIVEPEKVTDAQAELLASNIAEKIEGSLEYPGQIKVTVLRRLITTEFTDFQRRGQNHPNAAHA